jgi:hypothetical protein
MLARRASPPTVRRRLFSADRESVPAGVLAAILLAIAAKQ